MEQQVPVHQSHDQQPAYILAAAGTFIAVNTIFVALRFWVRSTQKFKLGADDWLSLFALIFVIGLGVCIIVGVHVKSFGYPTSKPSIATTTEQLEFAFQPIQVLAIGFTKLSFVFFYRRIFLTGKAKSVFNAITIGVIVILSLWTAGFFLAFIFSCGSHFAVFWGPHDIFVTECVKGLEVENAVAISDFLTDLIVLFIPIPMVMRLRMTGTRKLAVLSVFFLGFIALVASVVRMAIFVNATKAAFQKGVDNDLLITKGLYWAMIEAGLALTASCLPTLSALARTRSVDSVVGSIRSIVTLKSRASATSHTGSKGPYSDIELQRSGQSSDSPTVVRPVNYGEVESHVISGVPAAHHGHSNDNQSEIWVNHRIEQSASRV